MAADGLFFCKVEGYKHYSHAFTLSGSHVCGRVGMAYMTRPHRLDEWSPRGGGRDSLFGCDRPWLVVSWCGCLDKAFTFCFIRNNLYESLLLGRVRKTKQS